MLPEVRGPFEIPRGNRNWLLWRQVSKFIFTYGILFTLAICTLKKEEKEADAKELTWLAFNLCKKKIISVLLLLLLFYPLWIEVVVGCWFQKELTNLKVSRVATNKCMSRTHKQIVIASVVSTLFIMQHIYTCRFKHCIYMIFYLRISLRK